MHVRRQTPLASLTTLGIGGPTGILIEHSHPSEWPDLLGTLQQRPLTLGGGSNILAADEGCAQPVVRICTQGLDIQDAPDGDGVLVTAQAGHRLQDLVDTTIAECLTGMETLTGIPGTVGAIPVQNVGAYGQETSDSLVQLTAWDWDRAAMVVMTGADCRLGHRTSVFKGTNRWTILGVTLRLRRSKLSSPITYPAVADILDVNLGTSVPIADAAEAVLAVRRAKGMVLDPADPDSRSAGSVFLSPQIPEATAAALRQERAPVHEFPDGSTRVSASWLIKQAGFALGQRLAPGIRISTKQYTLVTEPGATCHGFAEAAQCIADTVRSDTGVRIRPELDLFGHEPLYERLRDR